MWDATARSEVICRLSTGALPIQADFTLVQVHAGGGTCRGCGRLFSVGEPRCVIDCAASGLGPFPMHAECFFVWGEACVRLRKREKHAFGVSASSGAARVARPPRLPGPVRMFCRTRLEMLTDRVHTAHLFAESVSRMRKSGGTASRAACEQARRQSLLAREAYDEHIRDHHC